MRNSSKKGNRGGRRKTRREVLHSLLIGNPSGRHLVDRFICDTDPMLSYTTFAHRAWKQEFQTEIAGRLQLLAEYDKLQTIGISYLMDPGWDSPSTDARVNLPEIQKAKKQLKFTAPDSISMISMACAPSVDGVSNYMFVPVVASLVIDLSDSTGQPHRNGAKRRILPSGTAPRPKLVDISIADPDGGDIVNIVEQFIDSPTTIRQQFFQLAKKTKSPTWGRSRALRELGLLQMESLLPLEKVFFGIGAGDEILRHALVKPVQQAKNTKRNKIALSRDDVLDQWWNDAFRHRSERNRPPFIKM